MTALVKLFRDLLHLHVGRRGMHRWTRWRERSWCTYCGYEER
jgi:hypothetical protein